MLSGMAKIMNEGRTLGLVKVGGCVGEECVIHECLGKSISKRAADTCYIENNEEGATSYLLVVS